MEYSIEHTDLFNGAKSVIVGNIKDKADAIKALKHRFECARRAGYTITEKAFADTDVYDEQTTSYFCYRSRCGHEQMLKIIEKI